MKRHHEGKYQTNPESSTISRTSGLVSSKKSNVVKSSKRLGVERGLIRLKENKEATTKYNSSTGLHSDSKHPLE